MRRLPAPTFTALIALVGTFTSACKDRLIGPAADDAAVVDGAARSDGTVMSLEIDFAATGCPQYDLAASRCSGPVPLTVTFAPIGSSSITRFLWDFGDGTPKSADRAPAHTYVLPGMFTVALVGAGSTGTVSRTRRQFIVAGAAGAGALCDVDGQCATGLECLCGSGAACGDKFPRGLCTTECRAGTCSGGAVCAHLAANWRPGAVTTDRIALCLAPCETNEGCARGLGCRSLPNGATPGQPAWVRGCFAPTSLDLGASCRTASGALSDDECVSGRCDDLGALGLCVASCNGTQACPPQTVCASFREGRTVCLRTCTETAECGRDPLIGCEPAGAPGALGFSFAPGSATSSPPANACAPKGCVADDDCGPAGVCVDGHCTRR
ncbi:MAG TPA: PKD domain-containing protein [Polyangia bacterium]|jgi:PKD repeat protein|nr:PKD domain-containing protein [Polyangia bacterium]